MSEAYLMSNGSSASSSPLFSIPSEPLQPKRSRPSASPFTRSQCLGGKLCVAGCILHRHRRRRTPSKSTQISTPVDPSAVDHQSSSFTSNSTLDVFSDDEGVYDDYVSSAEPSTIRTIRNYFVTHIRRISGRLPIEPDPTHQDDPASLDEDPEYDESVPEELHQSRNGHRSNRHENPSNQLGTTRPCVSLRKQKITTNRHTTSTSTFLLFIAAFAILLASLFLTYTDLYASLWTPLATSSSAFVRLISSSSSSCESSSSLSDHQKLISAAISARLIEFQNVHDKKIQAFDTRMRHLESVIEVQQLTLTRMNRTLMDALELAQRSLSMPSQSVSSAAAFSSEDVQNLIKKAIAKYDADKTGLTDFALETSGAQVLSIRCSSTFEKYGTQYSVFGIPFWRSTTSPRSVIQQNKAPGECWPFVGAQGHLVIKLSQQIVPSNFSYEHIPIQISRDGNLNSAPKHFEVRSLDNEDDSNGLLVGRYTYDSSGEPLQFFPVQHPNPKPTQLIELIVLDNHGHPEYTCLYRFRVHGQRVKL